MGSREDYIYDAKYDLAHEDEPEQKPTWCTECKQKCQSVEETFDYSGTHCTHGKAGTHHTGVYVSNCCSAECSDEEPEQEEDECE